MRKVISLLLIGLFCAYSCEKKDKNESVPTLDLFEVPPGFPPIEHSENNEYTDDRWLLGKKLFYDPILSIDGSTSCASCHDSKIAFSDNTSFSEGANGLVGSRNSPSLANVAYHPYFTREGGVPTLEMQVLVPIQEHDEFNSNIVFIADTLNTIPFYTELADKAYGQKINPFVITRAISLFERSLISGQSVYDMEFHYKMEGTMSEEAIRGLEIFTSEEAECSSCHNGFNFTDYSFQNNGLYENYADIGRQKLTNDENDNALFKVPSLRNVEVTAPYMHDGSLATLTDVLDHYNSGGKSHVNKSEKIKALGLTDRQKKDVIAFLESLTDENFIKNKDFKKE